MALPLLSGRFPLAITFGVDLLLATRQHILRCDIACSTVQADVVVILHIAVPVQLEMERAFSQ
jgi:hypothetical protein